MPAAARPGGGPARDPRTYSVAALSPLGTPRRPEGAPRRAPCRRPYGGSMRSASARRAKFRSGVASAATFSSGLGPRWTVRPAIYGDPVLTATRRQVLGFRVRAQQLDRPSGT